MRYIDDRYHLRVEIQSKQCHVPDDQLERMQRGLEPVGEAVQDFEESELTLDVVHHPRSGDYHVTARLRVPGRSLFTGERDPYLDSAFQRCARKLIERVADHRRHPNGRAEEQAKQRNHLGRDVVAPEGPDVGPLGAAVGAGDYLAFRNLLIRYEDWLRVRVGRWVQRYPDAQARLGRDLSIGDLVEEVYLNAFEGFARRKAEVPLHGWLDGLIDPSLKTMLRHPDEEAENARLARTLRETPLS
jgi:hypothetical protein